MRRVIALAVGLSFAIGLLVTAFVWPNSQLAPRDVPLAVAGPPDAVTAVESQLDDAAPGAFDVQPVPDADAARGLIDDRDVYGAVVAEPGGPPRMLIAPAASPVVAQLLEGIAAGMAGPENVEAADAPAMEDVAPLPEEDPRGIGFNAGALPMVMAGLAAGAAMSLAVQGLWRRLTGVLLTAVVGGCVAVLIMHNWLGVFVGSWWAEVGVFALTIAAVATTIVGLYTLIGRPGLALAAATMLLVGNPLSGLATSPHLLPSGWSALGQALPPGAGGSLLRSVVYFDRAGSGAPLLVLGCWIVGGVLVGVLGAAVARRRSQGGAQPRAEASTLSGATTNQAAPADR